MRMPMEAEMVVMVRVELAVEFTQQG